MALAMVNVGETKEIVAIRAKEQMKKHLQSLGFVIGEKVQVVADNASGIILLIKGTKIALNRGTANLIIVE